jgi:DNA processing protein
MINAIGNDELALLLELNKLNSFRSQFKKLRDGFDSLTELASASPARIAAVKDIQKRSAGLLAQHLTKLEPGIELDKVHRAGLVVIDCFDEKYPKKLWDLPQPPPVLYVNGDIGFGFNLSISVVGSRSTSQHGVSVAMKLAYELASAGFCIISGGARGIDSIAHNSALNAGGRTIAVMACGLDNLYPPENKELFAKISESGAVISEFPIGTVPEKFNFPTRNRIIAGLARATLVIEAGERSGALITAEHALELGRDVFAVPGRPTDMTSRGSNKLIRDGAFLAMSVTDITERFGLLISERTDGGKRIEMGSLTDAEREIYENVNIAPVLVDDLARLLEKNVAALMEPLISLQLKGLIKEMPGKSYVRTVG